MFRKLKKRNVLNFLEVVMFILISSSCNLSINLIESDGGLFQEKTVIVTGKEANKVIKAFVKKGMVPPDKVANELTFDTYQIEATKGWIIKRSIIPRKVNNKLKN